MSFVSDAPLDLIGPGTGTSTGATSGAASSLSLGGIGTAAAGGAGLAGLLSLGGGTSLPWEYGALTTNAAGDEAEASTLENQGSTFTNQGAQALQMAQNGQLTQPQQAQLTQYTQGLDNTAAQTYASMGRNINQDTSGISTQANIDSQVNAMAQQDIQSTIALGLGETSAGNSYDTTSLAFSNAANQALISAGQAQMTADSNYSNALSGVFSAIGSIAGGVIGGVTAGPVGAVAGATIGSKV
jgi:hypothetical protein